MGVIFVWLVLMTVGLVMTSWLLSDVLADRRIMVAAKISNGRMIIVNGDIRSAWVRVVMFGIFVLVGVIALLQRQEIAISPYATRAGLLFGAALLVWDAIDARRVRHKLMSEHGE